MTRRKRADTQGVDILKDRFSKLQIANRDADLNRTPYSAAAWAPKILSNGANGTINWVTTFGLPDLPKMVWLLILVRDEGSELNDCFFTMQAKNTTALNSIVAYANRSWNDQYHSTHAPVAVADNGTTYYAVAASGVNTMDVIVRVVAWMK